MRGTVTFMLPFAGTAALLASEPYTSHERYMNGGLKASASEIKRVSMCVDTIPLADPLHRICSPFLCRNSLEPYVRYVSLFKA